MARPSRLRTSRLRYRYDVDGCGDDLEDQSAVRLVDGLSDAGRGIKEPTADLMRGGRKFLPEEAVRLYEMGLPNIQTIQTEAPITAFMNRRRIVSAFDSLELEKRDTVVMAKSVYKVLNMYRKNRARYLMVPNATLGGDSDCSVPLMFDDIARRVKAQKRIHIPKCMMQSGRGLYTDIAGVTLEQFMKKTGVKATVLHKIDTKFANKLLWRNCLLKNYVEDYVRNPLVQSFESLPVPCIVQSIRPYVLSIPSFQKDYL